MQHLGTCLLSQLKLTEFCVFNCHFYKMTYSCYQESSGIHAPLVNVGNPISNGIVFVFHLAGCVREL